jgi:hypothetical protein
MTRDEISVTDISEALDLAMIKASKKMVNKGALSSTHEAYGKICEEVYEAMKEMHKNNTEAFKDELVDIMVACAWGIASLK